ncbi:MAG: DUF1294 domain-containing protein [Clostridia bacterium]|nr:DUF1294 domain-containing protein [Clostridia bacterium]
MAYFPLSWAITIYLVMNAVGVALLLWDRHLARSRSRKWVNELLLQFVGLLGGATGMTAVMFATRHKLRKPKFYMTLPLMTLVHIALLTVVAMFGPHYDIKIEIEVTYVLLYLAVVSGVGMVLTFVDKHRARCDIERLSEDTLMLWAGLGGAAAMLLTMLSIRHKTRHIKFMLGLPIMILIQGGLFFCLWTFSDVVWFYY